MNEDGAGEDLGATVVGTQPATDIAHALGLRSVLAVCAHPDDESFGLGAVLSTLTGAAIRVRVVCFTHGEALVSAVERPRRRARCGTLGCGGGSWR